MANEPVRYSTPTERRIAIAAEALYLCNLLILPLLSFLLLFGLYLRYDSSRSPLAKNHLRQALVGSLWAGVILIPVPLLTLVLSGIDSPNSWTTVLLYFIVCHTALVLAGIIGLARAMAGKTYRFPFIGGA